MAGGYGATVAAEMTRYVSSRFGWTSILIQHSTPALMDDLLLAGTAASRDVLSPESFNQLKDQLIAAVLADPGVGVVARRGWIRNQIPSSSKSCRPGSYRFAALMDEAPRLRSQYLTNWRDEFASPAYANDTQGPKAIEPRTVGAYLASFLLEVGFDAGYLARWLDYRTKHQNTPLTIARLIDDLVSVYSKGPGRSEIMVALGSLPPGDLLQQPGGRSGESVKDWLSANGFEVPRGIHGGLLFESAHWEIYSALRDVAEELDRISSKFRVRDRHLLRLMSPVWVKGVKRPLKLPDVRHAEEWLPSYTVGLTSRPSDDASERLEVSVEFLLSAWRSRRASAVAMLWASIESLLASPGDDNKAEAALRAANIAAIAFVRSQVHSCLGTLLSLQKSEPLGARLAITPREDRFRALTDALSVGDHNALSNAPARVHCEHAYALLAPDAMANLRDSLHASFLNIYRYRNLVLHGGYTDGPLLKSLERIAFPLVAGIVNRYSAYVSEGTTTEKSAYLYAYRCSSHIEAYNGGVDALVRLLCED